MGWQLEGDEYVLKERTRKPFERFKVDAARGLREGLPGFVTTHAWDGSTCVINSLGATGKVTFDHGEVVCRLRIDSFPATLFKGKILSDVEATTLDVCGALSSANKQIFIVHGHSPEKRLELKDFLIGLGLEPIILDEQDDRGLTIIEKFEYYATACSFAFILMTPDDGDKTDRFAAARPTECDHGAWLVHGIPGPGTRGNSVQGSTRNSIGYSWRCVP